jgi:hypothetical protein
MDNVEFVLGIDPGKKGALCLLSSDGEPYWIKDMPGTYGEWRVLSNTLQHLPSVIHAACEDVHSLFGMSAKSNFQFGGWVKTVQTIVGMSLPDYCQYDLIQPKVWQKDIGLAFPKGSTSKDRKQLAYEHAIGINPSLEDRFRGPKGGLLDGRVDAYLIAYSLWRQHVCYGYG